MLAIVRQFVKGVKKGLCKQLLGNFPKSKSKGSKDYERLPLDCSFCISSRQYKTWPGHGVHRPTRKYCRAHMAACLSNILVTEK